MPNYATNSALKSGTGGDTSNGFQNMFVSQPMLDTLVLKKEKDTDYVFSLKSKRAYNSKILYTAFLHIIKLAEYKVKIKFNKDPLAAEQNNYAITVVNAYIVYDLDVCPNNPVRNFTLKKILVWCK